MKVWREKEITRVVKKYVNNLVFFSLATLEKR